MKNLSDIEIIESVQRGNKRDYSLIVDRYKHKAFNLLKRMLKNQMDAEEALQDSFIKTFNSLGNFKQESQFSTWFYKIVYNTALTIISSKKYTVDRNTISVDDQINIKDEDENKIYSESENVEQYIFKMVDELPIKNALVVILFYIDNLSIAEISNIMDISLVNVKVLLHRSRNMLRELLLKYNYKEEIL
ncbi:MAG: RNA polymerase sigma factor [Ignavibacteriales bacterium]|nr:RNA polymerase sigma factor [Ignavibacteriales bacterium]